MGSAEAQGDGVMTPEELKRVANEPGFGTGKAVRDMAAAESEVLDLLPDPKTVPPVMASTDCASNWLIASFGNDGVTGGDWHLVTKNVRASETVDAALMQSALDDAQTIAAIINAYRLGVIRRADQ